MKIWIEFPETTRFARRKSDILYTPIFFANEGITGFFRLDDEWARDYNLADLPARIILSGRASLGYLSIGGRPANGFDTRYALPNVGFRPIYTLEIMEITKSIQLDDSNRIPFSFNLPTSTLEDIQQLASSMKVISADCQSTMAPLRDTAPALIVSVSYVLSAEVDPPRQKTTQQNQEVRIFLGLSSDQVPSITPEITALNPMAQEVTTQIVSLGKARRRSSIPQMIRRKSRVASSTSGQEDPYIIVEAHATHPFTFRRHDDAAATKVLITLTYHHNSSTDTGTEIMPPTITGNVQWMLKSLTTLTLEPLRRNRDNNDARDDYFHLRAKILPLRKLKLVWSNWEKQPHPSTTTATGSTTNQDPSNPLTPSTSHPTTSSNPQYIYTCTVPLWLTQPLTSTLTPSFITSYLTHLYMLSLTIGFSTSTPSTFSSAAASATTSSSLFSSSGSSASRTVDLSVPIQVRYDLGLAPSYEVDESLPEYDHTLPRYGEGEGVVEEGGAVVDDDGDEVLETLLRQAGGMRLEEEESSSLFSSSAATATGMIGTSTAAAPPPPPPPPPSSATSISTSTANNNNNRSDRETSDLPGYSS